MSLSRSHLVAQEDSLYFRQLLSGRDFAANDPIARKMVNFAYLIGDRSSGDCVVVDPAYAAADLVAIAAKDGMRITGALASHYHADHIGGSMMGFALRGIDELLTLIDVPIHINHHEREWVLKTTGVDNSVLVGHEDGDTVRVGSIDITLIHTPGHTPGSQCFFVRDRLVSGDTVFLDGCGRTDLPGSDAPSMFHSLRKIAALPQSTTIFPGHFYSSDESEELASVMRHNFVFGPQSENEWLGMFA